MNDEIRIKELKELRRLLIYDLKNTNKIEERIGNNPHLEAMRNLYLDQLNEIDRELKRLQY